MQIHEPTSYKPATPPDWVLRVNKRARKDGLPPIQLVRIMGFRGTKYTYKRQYSYRYPANKW